jgi:hypothetical protein
LGLTEIPEQLLLWAGLIQHNIPGALRRAERTLPVTLPFLHIFFPDGMRVGNQVSSTSKAR